MTTELSVKAFLDTLIEIDNYVDLHTVLSAYKEYNIPSSHTLSSLDPVLGSRLEEAEIAAPYLLLDKGTMLPLVVKQLKAKNILLTKAPSGDIYQYYLTLDNFTFPVSRD